MGNASQLGSLFGMLRNNDRGQYLTAPAMAGAGVAGVQLTTGAGAYGALANLVAAAAITTEFWLAGLSAYTANGAQVFQIQLYDTTLTTYKADFEIDPTATTLNWGQVMLPIPLYEAAGTQIQARAGGAAAKTINVRLHYLVGV